MKTVSTLRNPGVNYCEFIVSPVFPTCPVTGEPYAVEVTVKYRPAEDVIEYVAFEEWLRAIVAYKPQDPEELIGMTLEDVAAVTLCRARALLGDVQVCVIVEIIASYHCKAKAVAHTNNWRSYGPVLE